jgi:HAD superfamily hydrolase (TIGR01549 family)
MSERPIRAVVFDLDDTLIVEETSARASLGNITHHLPEVRAEDLIEAILARAHRNWHDGPSYPLCQELGFSSWEGLWSTFADCHPRLDPLRAWAPHYREQTWKEGLAALGHQDPELALLMADAYVEAQRTAHPLIDGADTVVRELGARFRIGLLTNGPTDIQTIKLEHAGLTGCFDTVVMSGQAGMGKPSPAVFARVLDDLGVSPDQAVMVGNSWERDVEGARAAGMGAVWIAADRAVGSARDGVLTVPSVADLPPLLDGRPV